MKTTIALLILFSAIGLPALGELTDADLNKIRLIVQEEIKKETDPINAKIDAETAKINAKIDAETAKINAKIDALDTRMRTVETGVAELRGRNIRLSTIQEWLVALCAVVAVVISIVALRKAQPKVPQPTQDIPKAVSQ